MYVCVQLYMYIIPLCAYTYVWTYNVTYMCIHIYVRGTYVYIIMSLCTYVYTCIQEFVDKENSKEFSINKNAFKEL